MAVRFLVRLVAGLVALALLVGGALVVVEIILAQLGQDPWVLPHDRWYDQLRRTPWSDDAVRAAAAGVAAAGLLLLLLQLLRRPRLALPLEPSDGRHQLSIDRRSVERTLDRAVRSVDGVAGADVRVRKRAARIRVATTRRHPEGLAEAAQSAADGRLAQLRLARPLPARVTLRQEGGR